MRSSTGVVLVGPYPPPHGGVSVHVQGLRGRLEKTGIPVVVVNATRGAPASDEYVSIAGGADLLRRVAQYAFRGWMVHAHINGHNTKSWLLALATAAGGLAASRRMLTVHSGLVPDYLNVARRGRAALVRLTCRRYERVVCVSEEVRAALVAAGVATPRLTVIPAYLGGERPPAELPEALAGWLAGKSPLLAATLAFEPEYRFDMLAQAIARLRQSYPRLGCVVMGTGRDQEQGRRLVRRLGLGGAVLLLGDVGHELCLRLLEDADLYVRCTDRDGDAISVREALARATPVVASDVGERPPGTVLFPAGDLDAMVRRIEETLTRGPTVLVPLPATAEGSSVLAGLYETA